MTSGELLRALGSYLAGQGLAQYSETSDYLDSLSLPSVLFGASDTPDHCVVLGVTGRKPSFGEFEVSMTFRAVGIDGLAVSGLADAVSDHLREAFDFVSAGVWSGGSIVTLPSVVLPGGLRVVGCAQTVWGTAEHTSPAKHKGSRFIRTDVYRLVVR